MNNKRLPYVAKKPDQHGIVNYSLEEHTIWRILLERQIMILQNRACEEYLHGIKILNLSPKSIPQLGEINNILKPQTSWNLEPVSSLIQAEEFFSLLAHKKFPVATFIRRLEDLDYIDQPDIFHEIIGHCPMLTHAPYANFLQHYAKLALRSSKQARIYLGRLFFFTIETGLIQTSKGLRIYGAGILSSQKESMYALESKAPERVAFDLEAILKTRYGLENLQKKYYIINNFNMLYTVLDSIASKCALDKT